VNTLNALLAKVETLLQGEPLRLITYGAIAVVLVVSRILALVGVWPDATPMDAVLVAVGAAFAALNEVIRSIVSSPATVAAVKDAAISQATPPAV